MRVTWNKYFMEMARLVSSRATCDRRKVGAVIVSPEKHIVATGYNGSGSGMPHCDSVGHLLSTVDGNDQCVRAIHAEQNAIGMAAKLGHKTQGAILYCTALPCLNCAKSIVSAGINTVFYDQAASDQRGLTYMMQAGIHVFHIDDL